MRLPDNDRRRRLLVFAIGSTSLLGLVLAFVSVIDPYRSLGMYLGPALTVAAAVAARRRAVTIAAVIAACYGCASPLLVEFRADSSSYFAYLRSVSFDGDLDFENDWDRLRDGAPAPFQTRRDINVFSAGPAVLWSPFFWAAHAYVRLDQWMGRGLHADDGASLPYRRATLAGTIAVVVIGASLLAGTIAKAHGAAVALVAVAGAALASPVAYYTFLVPAMPHGVTFGVASAFLWAWHSLRDRPSRRGWIVAGALLGVLSMCRWQAAVYGLFLAPLAVTGLTKRTLPWSWLALSAAAAAAAFLPQSLAWRIGFGEWVLIPQGRGFLDLASPHWLDTLISADRGLFNWTPLMLVGFVGLLSGLARDPQFHGVALAVVGATAWINGSVPGFDWAGGDAFGARRYSLVVPLLAFGLARAIDLGSRAVKRWPLLVPATVVAGAIAWNLGFISNFRARRYPGAASSERLASDQARSLRKTFEAVMGAIAGAEGRALAYKVFSAEYFYTEFNKSGTIMLRAADERYLLEGWHTGSRRIARRTFRRALYPRACVRIPLQAPFALRVTTTARAPDGLSADQIVTFVVNETRLASAHLTTAWRELSVAIPEHVLLPGENAFCLSFASALNEDARGRRVAAEVERIQLP